ncbi:MAG: RNA methyltransferase [Bdellovibrionales bacterium]|nr:RNA methyltransferase [Bdellovibrionales bacterium]
MAEHSPSHPLEQFVQPERIQRMNQVLMGRSGNIVLVLDHIHNPHNLSAAIRSADAFGIQTVIFCGPPPQLASGITVGVERWIDLVSFPTADETLQWLHQHGYATCILEPPSKHANQQPIPVQDLPFDEPLALIFGNEVAGPSDAFVRAAHHRAYIPMFGFVESLNISVAVAITLFCSTLERPRGARRTQTLTEEAMAAVRDRWLRGEVRGADLILQRLTERSEP